MAPAEPVDGKAYYGYLFEQGDQIKKATKVLDALLRAIAQYIIDEIGDKTERTLTPPKLAAFYHAVGGNFDSLFNDVPPRSLSFIYQVTGCQHTLQPVPHDNFAPPSIPALTLAGFVKWESVEILLDPEEHVPFIQYAVQHWSLKNPDTGEPFPTDLPKEAFPLSPDPEVERWHNECAEHLREQATPKEEPKADVNESRVRDGYSHVHAKHSSQSPRRQPEADYFSRPVPYTHVPANHTASRQAQTRSRDQDRHLHRGSSSDDRQARRKSFSDYPSPPHEMPAPSFQSATHLAPHHAQHARRHSQPRLHSTSSESDEAVNRRMQNRPHHPRVNEPPPPSGRRQHRTLPPLEPGAQWPSGAAPATPPTPRSSTRDGDGTRRHSQSSTFDGIREKISSILPGIVAPPDRPRSHSRSRGNGSGNGTSSGNGNDGTRRYSRENVAGSRLSQNWSTGEYASGETDSDVERERRRRRREREQARDHDRDRDRQREPARDKDRGRDLDRRERERNRGRDDDVSPKTVGAGSRERNPQRPQAQRRTSSHADIDRRRDYPPWDGRDRDRVRDRDRDRNRELYRYRGDKRPAQARNESPVMVGVGGRKYPNEAAWS